MYLEKGRCIYVCIGVYMYAYSYIHTHYTCGYAYKNISTGVLSQMPHVMPTSRTHK